MRYLNEQIINPHLKWGFMIYMIQFLVLEALKRSRNAAAAVDHFGR